MKALLIVGHGSKSEKALKTFEKIVTLVSRKSEYDHVMSAHLQISVPGIEEAIEVLVEKGVTAITLVPYFLFDGIHTRKEIPAIVEKLLGDHPGITISVTEPIGYEPIMADIILERARTQNIG